MSRHDELRVKKQVGKKSSERYGAKAEQDRKLTVAVKSRAGSHNFTCPLGMVSNIFKLGGVNRSVLNDLVQAARLISIRF